MKRKRKKIIVDPVQVALRDAQAQYSKLARLIAEVSTASDDLAGKLHALWARLNSLAAIGSETRRMYSAKMLDVLKQNLKLPLNFDRPFGKTVKLPKHGQIMKLRRPR